MRPTMIAAALPGSLIAAALMSLASGCGGSGATPTVDMAIPTDLALGPRTMINLTGKFASQVELKLTVDHGADGGVKNESLNLYTLWTSLQTPNPDGTQQIDNGWEYCALALPENLPLPYANLLQKWNPYTSDGVLDGITDGANYTQPTVWVTRGARAATTAPLPDRTAPACCLAATCAPMVTTGCLEVDPTSMLPTIAVPVSGMTPDVDTLYLDVRIGFALSAKAKLDLTVNGTVTSASLEWHVIGCHLRSAAAGVLCDAATVAALEAQRPTVTVNSGGVFRSHEQGYYFSCPQFMMDPEAALTGSEAPPDGGALDLAPAAAPTFSVIQRDLDQMGCATGKCHGTFTRPGAMQLTFSPTTDALRWQNYQAVLPWTSGPDARGNPVIGGRFVNEVNLSAPMRQRWLQWIEAGRPY